MWANVVYVGALSRSPWFLRNPTLVKESNSSFGIADPTLASSISPKRENSGPCENMKSLRYEPRSEGEKIS